MFYKKKIAISKVVGRNQAKQRDLFALIVLSLILGLFMFAWIDEDARDAFAEIAKIGVAGYVALLVPSRYDDSSR